MLLLALAVLVGGFALDLLVVPRDPGDVVRARRRLDRWISLAVVVLILTAAIELVARARIMSGGDLSQVGAALPLVLTRTHYGSVWIARAAALILLLAVSLSRSRPARIAGLVLAVGVVLTVTLTGHADDWGDRSFTVLVDWLHALAATAWAGGLFGLAIAIGPGWATSAGSPAPSEPITTVCRRFSRLAGWCLAIVIASGIYNAWAQVPTLAALWTTTYGAALLLKICWHSCSRFWARSTATSSCRPSTRTARLASDDGGGCVASRCSAPQRILKKREPGSSGWSGAKPSWP